MTRVLGQVVTGIGFLGAGVIIARGGHVKGVTSAAVIWTLAGIGAMIGFGLFAPAIALAVVTVVILTSLEFLETNIHWLRRGEHAPDGDSGSREE